MQRIITGGIVIVTATLLVAILGCSKNSTVEPSQTDLDYYSAVMNGGDGTTADIATSDVAAYDDGTLLSIAQAPPAAQPSIQSIDTAGFVPQRWGRRVLSVTRSIANVTVEGDTVAFVRVQSAFTGTFVVAGLLNGTPDTVRKPFVDSLHRIFRFVRVARTTHPFQNWRLDAVSIANGATAGSPITITEVQVVPPSGDTITATDPDTYFLHVDRGWQHHFPLWGFNSTVTVGVTITSPFADTDLVTVHYVPRNFGLHRAGLTFVSQTFAGGLYTRIYSATWTIPGNDKKFSHVLLSAISHATLFSADSTQIAATVWGVPYKTSE